MFDSVSDGLVRSIWGGPFVEWEELGGQWNCRRDPCVMGKTSFGKQGSRQGPYSIFCLFYNVEDGFDWFFTGVHGPNNT